MSSEQQSLKDHPPLNRRLALGTAALSALAVFVTGIVDGVGPYTAVAIGSALGGMARHWCTVVSIAWLGDGFPWGTLFINVLGSFVIGFFFGIAGPDAHFAASANTRLFVMTGLCGGYTTFSAFSLQTLSLFQSGAWFRAGCYIASSVVLCLIAVAGGYALARALGGLSS